MSNDIKTLENAINDFTRQGKMLEAINAFYAENCVFTESDGSSRQSRAEQVDHLIGFLQRLKALMVLNFTVPQVVMITRQVNGRLI